MLQPDQDPALWDHFVPAYEMAFEPLTNQFVARALEALSPRSGQHVLDICAGSGGGAMLAAAAGARVTAVDASPAMIARIEARASASPGWDIEARVMDAAMLVFSDAAFDAALSCFGIVLLPDPMPALKEAMRVLKPGAPLVLVTWTEPRSYELAARLRQAAGELGVAPVPGPLPAQLRYAEPNVFSGLVETAGFEAAEVQRMVGNLTAPSARWLSENLAFAPGLSAMLDGFGEARGAIVEAFAGRLASDQGPGPVSLSAVAHLVVARAPR